MCLILVYDLSNKDSFNNVSKWTGEVDRYLDNVAKLVIGNKLDLGNDLIAQEEVEELADTLGCETALTSCKTGEGFLFV